MSSDNPVANPFVADTADLCGYKAEAFESGVALAKWDESAWLRASKPENDGDPDDVLQAFLGIPVYSGRLRRALDAAEVAGIQYLRVRVLRPNDVEIGGFAIGNVLNAVAALDHERSDYDVFPGDYFLERRRGLISGIRRASLRAAALEGYDVVRLKEYPVSLYVSGRFRDVFRVNGFTGYSFDEVRVG